MEFKINVEGLHFAEITESEEGELVFGKPEHIPGAMEVGRNPQISQGRLYGDGKVSHSTSRVNSYQISVNQNKLPSKWRRYMEGKTVTGGVESGTSKDEPKPFAIGWTVEKTGGAKELIWFLYCKTEPIQETVTQSEDNINYSTDSVTITALEHDSLGRFYTFIDTEDEEITPSLAEDFFKKVQIDDAISAA
ncbi:MAG TPA: hypothetical protein GX707_08360 [Epulopiscium sp.]|nr:hypothetical protein [Candidatus Epulonipiscium sp.]